MKVDLHVHTLHSADSLTLLPEVLYWARRRGLDALAITDHNTIEGALALRHAGVLPIIVGEEIRTTHGEIIALFIEERVPPDLSPLETIARIREQGGLVCVPHPTDRVRGSALAPRALYEVAGLVDAIEVLNARVMLNVDNRLAKRFAEAHGLLQSAGSDAHQYFEIGRAYVEMPAFHDAPSFLEALARGRVCGHISSPFVHMGSTYARVAKNLRREVYALR